MSFTYTPDPTSTKSPAASPAAGVGPQLTIPSDGDPANVASILQALEVLADYAAFEQAPFANANAWIQRVRAFANARLQAGLFLDHNGLPNGRFYEWIEEWVPGTPFNLGPGAGINGRWTYGTNSGTAGGVSPQAPGSGAFNPWNTSKALVLTLDGSATGKYGYMAAEPTSCFTDDAYASVDLDFSLASVLDVNWVVGLSAGEAINAIAHGLFLIRPTGAGTNLLLRSIAGGSPTTVDSGILGTAGVPHHLSIQWWGANVADDSAAHAILTLDGFSTDITTTLPNTGGPFAVTPTFGGTVTSAVANPQMIVGPVRYCQITPR